MKSQSISRLSIIISLILIPLAAQATVITEKCPSISAIANASFSSAHVSHLSPDKWAVEQIGNKYGLNTPLNWDFAILLDAKSQEDAFLIAKNSFSLMKMPDAPTHIGNGFLLCEYKMPTGFRAIAGYPSGYIYP